MKMKNLGLMLCVACTAISVLPGTVRAQSLRPNILFIFDTSASMELNDDGTGTMGGTWVGENTNICPGGATSRIYNLKNALRAALAEIGTDEANFGLMAFPQTVITPAAYPATCNPAAPSTCNNWCRDTNAEFGPVGHYQATPQGAGLPGVGCSITTQTTNQTTYDMAGGWFDMGVGQVVLVGLTTALPPALPAAANYDPADGNIPEIYKWIDNVELPKTTGPVTDPELHGGAYTPLGRSLLYAKLYFQNFVQKADPKAACRQNIIVLVTDGAEECDTTAPAAASFSLTACTGGGTYSAFHPIAQACQLNVNAKIKTYVITDSSLNAAGLANDDRIAAAGGTTSAIKVSLTNVGAAQAAIVGIIAATVPPAETCNGVDDNCNGVIDEGVSNACGLCIAGNNIPACGTFVIDPKNANDPDNLLGTGAKHCAVETCNCLDDNCNGVVDEGLPVNACGGPCGCAVPAELCNGLDDNCNGDIDEGFNVGMACDNGLKGACHRTGITACNAAGTGTFCDAPVIMASTEVCNGIDDNCNGQVDEGTLPGVGIACGTALGNCKAGITVCVNGQIVCNTTSTPMPEICNGLDDNCDGVIDNGNFPQTGMTCLCAGLTQAQVGVGICRAGHLVCEGTKGFVCEGCVLPGTEICDGKDNDCDGTIDVSATCPSGLGCKDGQCSVLCRPGEVPCSGNFKCVSGYCVPALCASVTCPAGTHCDETTGKCADLCLNVVCTAPKFCQNGTCIDCNTIGCDTGQLCVGGLCQTDKCAGVTCQANQYCQNGACVALCTPDKCTSATDRCVAGQCIPNKCAGVGCPDSQFCDPTSGACTNDPCAVMQCTKGLRCVQTTGQCAVDPCLTINCPGPCWQCTTTADGTGTCSVSGNCVDIVTKVGNKGGGADGCGCSLGAGGDPLSRAALFMAAVGLAGTLASRRPRRRRRGA